MIATVDSPYIHEGTSENFQVLVLENSHQGPVLVNFWSKKVGQCLRQYPILNQLVHHYAGRVLLVNINTEREISVCKEQGIASAPILKLFRRAQSVETMYGFQAENEIKKLLDRYVSRDSDLILANAIEYYIQGKHSEAYETIANAIVDDPENPRLPLTACKLLKHEKRYTDALKLVEALPEEIRQNPEVVQFHELLSFYLEIDQGSDMPALLARAESAPKDMKAKQQLIAHYVVQQQYESALQLLTLIIDKDPLYNDKYAQKTMLRVFNIIGREHPLVAQFRTSLKRFTH